MSRTSLEPRGGITEKVTRDYRSSSVDSSSEERGEFLILVFFVGLLLASIAYSLGAGRAYNAIKLTQ